MRNEKQIEHQKTTSNFQYLWFYTYVGNIKFANPLKPCCIGINPEYHCGSVDEDGNKKYVLCNDPNSAFFWDGVHPTQQGWIAALTILLSTMKQHF